MLLSPAEFGPAAAPLGTCRPPSPADGAPSACPADADPASSVFDDWVGDTTVPGAAVLSGSVSPPSDGGLSVANNDFDWSSALPAVSPAPAAEPLPTAVPTGQVPALSTTPASAFSRAAGTFWADADSPAAGPGAGLADAAPEPPAVQDAAIAAEAGHAPAVVSTAEDRWSEEYWQASLAVAGHDTAALVSSGCQDTPAPPSSSGTPQASGGQGPD